jgi:hypothetical protein
VTVTNPLFKIANFRADRVSGWCYDPAQPEINLTLKLIVNGETARVFECNRYRSDLDPTVFPSRRIGFAESLPIRFWNGSGHEVKLVEQTHGVELISRTVVTEDVRVTGVTGLYSRTEPPHQGKIRGWAISDHGVVRVQLDVDGVPYGSEAADGPTWHLQPPDCGFVFWLPPELYDRCEHRLTVSVLDVGGRVVQIADMHTALEPADAPGFEGELVSFEDGVLSGTLRRLGWPDSTVTLVAMIDGYEAGRTDTNLAQGGAFALTLLPEGSVRIGQDSFELYTEPNGATPDFLAGDLLAERLSASLAINSSLQWAITVSGPLPLSAATKGILELPATGQSFPVTFQSGDKSGQLQALFEVPEGSDPAGAQLRFGDGLIPAILASREIAALPLVDTSTDPDFFTRTLAALVLGHPGGAGPLKTLGHWQFGADGRVTGWSVDFSTGTAAPVHLLLNGIVVAKHPGTLPTNLASGLPDGLVFPLAVPCGFEFDLAAIGHAGGLVRVEVVTGAGVQLHAPTQVRVRMPFKAKIRKIDPGQAFDLPKPPVLDEAMIAMFLSPVSAELSPMIAQTFGLKEGPEGPLATVLSEVRRRLATDTKVLSALASPGGQLDPLQWPPAADLPFLLLDHLPLAQATRTAARRAQNWRAFIRCLVADPVLFPSVSYHTDWLQSRDLWRLRRAAGTSTAAAVVMSAPFDADAPIPAALMEASRVLMLDAAGHVALDMSPAEAGATVFSGALSDIATQLIDNSSPARAAGWLVFVFPSEGPAQISEVIWRDARQIPAGPVDPRVDLADIVVAARHARIVLSGDALPPQIVLRTGTVTSMLSACTASGHKDGSDGATNSVTSTAVYAGSLAPIAVPASGRFERAHQKSERDETFDLRLENNDGPMPSGLPRWLVVAQDGGPVASEPRWSAGALTGWIFDPSDVPGSAVVELVETIPRTAEDFEADPYAQPRQEVVARVIARRPSPEANARHGVKECGYAVNLPPRLLDGKPHRLHLALAAAHGAPHRFWEADFTADTDFLMAQLRECTKEGLGGFLSVLAATRQFGVLETYFRNPHICPGADLTLDQSFAVLCTAVINGASSPQGDELKELLGSIWLMAAQDKKRLTVFTQIASRTLLANLHDVPAKRFPHGPGVEAVMDLLIALPLANAEVGVYDDVVAASTIARRLPLAKSFVERGLEAYPKNAALSVQAANIALALGELDAAESFARQALEAKPKPAKAAMTLAHVYARRGQYLEAASVLSAGKGLSLWGEKPPSYEEVKLISGLDWVGVMLAAAEADGRAALASSVEQSVAILGPRADARTDGVTIVLKSLTDEKAAAHFSALSPHGAQQIFGGLEGGISEIECIGRWVLILTKADKISPVLLRTIVEQMRPFETVARLFNARGNDLGMPPDFVSAGALIRVDVLRAFGPCSLDDYLNRASVALRVKSLLI